MSRFISLPILASLGVSLARSKKTANRETPGAPPVAPAREVEGMEEERRSSSRMRIAHTRVEG
ncbi:MAG TPA: hypothetical protein VGI39_34130 [Polyangiaceae bacterium]